MSQFFETTVTGKWILAGEHSVLRGSPALVFPLHSKKLKLDYIKDQSELLKLELSGSNGEELSLLVWGVIERACELKKISRSELKGKLKLTSNIPIGAGMGASAALCVAIARWFEYLGYVDSTDLYEFARTLENMFHGESSGVDIAVAISGKGLHFERSGIRKELHNTWSPRWFVSYTGKRGVTMECVSKVKSLIERDPELGRQIDLDMKTSVLMCEQALEMDEDRGFVKLVEAINLAASCFLRWGLQEGEPERHLNWLRKHGAAAVKPTGSGDGGFALSLWATEPPNEILEKLIPCN